MFSKEREADRVPRTPNFESLTSATLTFWNSVPDADPAHFRVRHIFVAVADYVPPKRGLDAFSCPHCGAYAHQEDFPNLFMLQKGVGGVVPQQVESVGVTRCARCQKYGMWLDGGTLVYPALLTAPLGSPDTPTVVAADYDEARTVFSGSPRAAGGLLRLAIQNLCRELGQPGDNLNADIGALVREGLPVRIQRALDVVRVIGNNAVHPGEIDLRDDVDTVGQLFVLVNLIVDAMITQPRAIDGLFNKLPEGAKRAIESRDKTD